MTRSTNTGYCVVGGLLLAVLLALHTAGPESAVVYAGVFIAASLLYLLLAWLILRFDLSPGWFRALLVAAAMLRLSFVSSEPVGSDDVYRYMWDGKVQASGINPYRHAPDDPLLSELHSDRLPALVNHPDMKSLYFPLSEWIFLLCYRLSGEGIWGYKLALLVAEIASFTALSRLAVKTAGSPRYALLYALCPLPVLQFAVDAHLDGVGIPIMAFGLLAFMAGRKPAGLVLLGLAMSIKPVALVFLPILFLSEKDFRSRIMVVVIPPVTVAVQFIPYLLGSTPFQSLMTFTQHWLYNGALFEVINALVADNQRSRIVCAVVFGIALVLLASGRRSLPEKFFYAVFILLLCSPVVHPWYVTWLVALLPLVPRWSGIVYGATVSLTSFTIVTYSRTGVWTHSPLAMIAEYLPVLILLTVELTRRLPPGPVPVQGARPSETR